MAGLGRTFGKKTFDSYEALAHILMIVITLLMALTN